MPIVRVNEKGEKIPDEVEVFVKDSIRKSEEREEAREAEKRRTLKNVSVFAGIGTLAATGIYCFVSQDLGIFMAVVSSTVASILNLYAD